MRTSTADAAGSRRHIVVVCVLTVIGLALRLIAVGAPLTHDELSAICRLRFSTFAELMQFGVRPDGHPAGMQVLLWLWSGAVGGTGNAALLRLPFVLISAMAVPLMYSVARRWYGTTAAALAALAVAASQYGVYYGSIVRPYGVGLTAILLLLHFWTRLCLERSACWPHVVGFAIMAAACAYLHYFCALQAALLAVGGLFFASAEVRPRYLLACACAVLLFVPHLGITCYQLFELRGVGAWLGRPEPVFLWRYLRYLTHHSYLLMLLVAAALLSVATFASLRRRWPLATLAALLFIVPFAAGYIYSRAVNPVLQFSVLIFAWPFLLLALLSPVIDGHRAAPVAVQLCGVALLSTLLFVRRHYDVIQREYIPAAAAVADASLDSYPADDISICMSIESVLLAHCSPTAAAANCPTPSPSASHLLVCAWDPTITTAYLHDYPYVMQSQACTVAPLFLLSRSPADGSPWPCRPVAQGEAHLDSEFCDIADTALADILASRHDVVCAHATSSDSSLLLVIETWVGGRRLDWRSAPFSESEAHIALPENAIVKSKLALRRARIKVYIWSPSGTADADVQYNLHVFQGDPYKYSILEEI